MTDLLPTITPKSDQLNADDLIGRSITVKVTKVLLSGAADQPISVHYEGDNGKPYKPCKSMRRVMVQVWGRDGAKFEGRSMTLYRDDTVQFGGAAVGGIRISHMSHIERDITLALTATRASRKPYVVRPLRQEQGRPKETRRVDDDGGSETRSSSFNVLAWADEFEASLPDYSAVDPMREDWQAHKNELHAKNQDRFRALNQAVARRAAETAMKASADDEDEIPF